MNILSIDASLTATGVCLPTGETFVIEPKKLRGPQRYALIRDEILHYCDSTGVDVVIIEGYSFGSKGRAVFQIGGLGEIIRLALYEKGIPYVEVPPACLKRYATGKGNASKDEVLQQAVVRSGHTFKDNNAADSWWLFQMAAAYYGGVDAPIYVPMPALNLKALEGVEWV